MPASSLSVAGSEIFKERLADLRLKKGWSYNQVGSILCCSRSTAINLLKVGNRTRVKAAYAKKLEPHIEGEIPWSSTAINDNAIKRLLCEWAAADQPHKRRKLAARLVGFLSEYLVVSYKLCVTYSVEVSALENPVSAILNIKNRGSNLRYDLLLAFDLADRTKLPMMLYNQESARIYNGHLSRSVLNGILLKIKSWQSKI